MSDTDTKAYLQLIDKFYEMKLILNDLRCDVRKYDLQQTARMLDEIYGMQIVLADLKRKYLNAKIDTLENDDNR